MKSITLAFAILVCACAAVEAQTSTDPVSTARIHLGPLGLSPTFGVANVGIDDNIFNEVDSANPKSDFTATLTSRIPVWMRFGRGRLIARSAVDYVYFNQYSSERALNGTGDARIEFPGARITPFVTGSIVSARERPGYEIDLRARRRETGGTAGVDVKLGGRSSATISAWERRVNFDGNAVFFGTSLREALDRSDRGARVILSRHLTPVTSLSVLTEAQRDRFAFAASKNSNSIRVMPGIEFGQFTLITGSVRVGYRDFRSESLASRFRGAVAAGDLGYTLLGRTRFAVHTERDLQYSYDITQPYYVQTGNGLVVTYRVAGRWDLQATVSRYAMNYTRARGSVEAVRRDRLRTRGGGLGYTLGRNMRVSLDIAKYERQSNRAADYNSLRWGTSVAYGF